MQLAVGLTFVGRFGSLGPDRQGYGHCRGQHTSRGDFEFDLELAAGRRGKSILQKAQIIVLEPHTAKFVRGLEGDVVAFNRASAQGRKPHVERVIIQLGTKMFPSRIPNLFSRKLHLRLVKKPVF